MKTFFTSDPHFGHKRIIDLCNRPFNSISEMDWKMVYQINETVSSSDRLVILGDLCMGELNKSLEVFAQIQAAEIVLVPGNHDRWSLAYHHKGTEDEQAAKRALFQSRYEEVRPNVIALTDWKPSVWSYGELTLSSHEVLNKAVFSHYPYDGDSHGEDRHGFLRARDAGAPIIHGHVHGEWKTRGRQFNVGVDVNDFTPVSEEELAEWIETL